jgi:hypothetical protein
VKKDPVADLRFFLFEIGWFLNCCIKSINWIRTGGMHFGLLSLVFYWVEWRVQKRKSNTKRKVVSLNSRWGHGIVSDGRGSGSGIMLLNECEGSAQ